jgi:predicted ATP-grasp superfamily ATP-dependent carboligase
VVVLGAESQGLGIVRQLGEAGIPSFTVDQDATGIARFSRYSGGFARSPAYADEEAFTGFLSDLAVSRGLSGWTLFPTDDEQVRSLSRQREELGEHYRVWTQEWEKISLLYMKDLFYQHLEGLSLPHPVTLRAADIEKLGQSGMEFPVIVKPVFKRDFYRVFRSKAVQCDDMTELVTFLEKASGVIPPEQLLVQERIPGRGGNQFSFVALAQRGEPVFQATAQRVRQHPMDFGHASTYVVQRDVTELIEPSLALLRSIGYTGVCEVEYMLDQRDSVYKVLEVNPRFWGWHTITRACGVNLPEMLYNLVYGLDQPAAAGLPGSSDWVKTITDLPVGIAEVFRGNLSPASLLRQHFTADENATFWPGDPLPFLAEWVLIPWLWFRRGY